jgi:hypothetical protein
VSEYDLQRAVVAVEQAIELGRECEASALAVDKRTLNL